MAISAEYKSYIAELLSPLGAVEVKSMFGGAGAFLDGVMFAILADGLYFKVDDLNRPDYEQAGSEPFTYEKNGKAMQMSYWLAPDELYDDPDAMTIWARKAHDAARRSARPKAKSGRKRGS